MPITLPRFSSYFHDLDQACEQELLVKDWGEDLKQNFISNILQVVGILVSINVSVDAFSHKGHPSNYCHLNRSSSVLQTRTQMQIYIPSTGNSVQVLRCLLSYSLFSWIWVASINNFIFQFSFYCTYALARTGSMTLRG